MVWTSYCVYLEWSLHKNRGIKLFVFLLCPIIGESLKGDKACQCQSFHMLQLSGCVWHFLVTSMKAGKEVTTRPSRCSLPLSLLGAQICRRWIGKTVLWNTEIASVASEEAHLSTGYRQPVCDNEVIKRWHWGIPANGQQHPGDSHLLKPLCFNSEADLWRVRAGWFTVSKLWGWTVMSYWIYATGESS